MTQSYTPSQIADGILAGEITRDSAFVPLAEVERLRAERRERIATAALQGMLSHPETQGSAIEFARMSIRYADALIAALDQEPQP